MNWLANISLFTAILLAGGCANVPHTMNPKFQKLHFGLSNFVDPELQVQLEQD